MFRRSWPMIALLMAATFASGCCFRDRPLFSRLRSRGQMPEQCPNNYQYFNGGYEGQAMGIPCSMPSGPCPCSTVPGGVIPGPISPEGMELIPGGGLPPLQMQPPAPPSAPGNAAPMPAGPSDGSTTGLRKPTAAAATPATPKAEK